MFIFDYTKGQMYKHYLPTREAWMNRDDVFEAVCYKNNICHQDANYMITSEDEIITI